MPNDTPPTRSMRSGSSSTLTLVDIKQLIESVRGDLIKEIESLKLTIVSLQSKVVTLEVANQELQERCSHVERELILVKDDRFRICTEISNEVNDRVGRRHNLVISGVSEREGENDKEKCRQIFTVIGFDLNDNDFETNRIGRVKADGTRLVRVKFKEVMTRDSILQKAKDLRNQVNFKSVFINPDRTPLQQKHWKELLDEVKKRKTKGEDVVIFRNRIVPRRNFRTSDQNF